MGDYEVDMKEEQELSPEIYQALAAGRKIDAIKLIRQETGLGLAEAKDIADALSGHKSANTAPPTAMPPTMKEEGGVGGFLAIVVAILIAGVVYVVFLGG